MYLQRIAMVTNQKQTLTFDTTQNTYCYNNKKEKLCSSVLFGTCTNVKGPPSTPTIIIDKPITCAGYKITFTPNGIAQPGTVYLTDKQKQYQYALTIPVSQISFLRMYRYDGTWKPLN